MAVSVVMPALEMAQETGKLVSWLKEEGDTVRKGEILLEVETDKAVLEIEAAGDGILACVTAKPGDVVQVGRTIAWLVQPGETPPTTASPGVAAGQERISPKARRLAQEHGIDVKSVKGSGPGGEILADDILAAAGRLRVPAPTPERSDVAGPASAGPPRPQPSRSRLSAVSWPSARRTAGRRFRIFL